ncbi:MAG: hypothetical protein ACJA13_001740 [Paraglaciecola sp.]|jgi:hypothetical protein
MSPTSDPYATDTKKWYKQFWPWFLIAFPLCSMILSFNMLRFAFNGDDSMVVDDYYKQGRAINLSLGKIEKAKALNIKSLLTISGDQLTLSFPQGQPQDGSALKLSFYHVTQKYKDQAYDLIKDASGVYRATAARDLGGKWRVVLEPHDSEWKIQQTLSFPQARAIPFNP